jgi:hypothetical protein
MLDNMRTLHPRGAANRGICVDAEGAMLGPDCVLVRRAPGGFRSIARANAAVLQKCLLDGDQDRDWLFRQCRRIADALDKGELALAQIYGLRIPVDDLDNGQLRRLAAARFSKNFDPDEPRIPKGDPHGGEWTTGGEGGAEGSAPRPRELQIAALDDVPPLAGTAGGDWQPASSGGPPMKWEIVPRDDATTGDTPAATADTDPSAAGTLGFDFPTSPTSSALGPPGIDAINPDYTIENLLFGAIPGVGFGLNTASRSLSRALAAIGITRPLGFVTHHIVAVLDKRALPAQGALERLGIEINDAENGVFLPTLQHDHLHSNAYYTAINRALAGAKTKSEAEEILRSIARQLEEGTFP